ncbi:Fibronectin type III domain-containing protein [Brevibacillus sp. IT-7CA2]
MMVQALINQKLRIVLMVTIAFMLTIGSTQAYAKNYYLQLTPSDHSVVGQTVFFIKGSTIYYEWENAGSTHAVGFGVYYFDGSSSKLIDSKVAGSGSGNAWNYVTAPYSGNYFLRANCGGAGQTGCNGIGFIRD